MVGSPTASALAVEAKECTERADAEAKEQLRLDQEATAERLKKCDAFLQRAQATEDEAALAVKDREAADQRLRDAMARVAVARKSVAEAAGAEASGVEDGDNKGSHASDPPPDTNTLGMHEAAALLHLHSQVVAVHNIRLLVPTVLDLASNNYTRWREQFLLTIGKFSLQDHVERDAPAVILPDWDHMDCAVRSWIYRTISNDLVETVLKPRTTTHVIWLAVESQFLDDREQRAILLDTEFRTFVQGDLSISEYCRRLKTMVDALGDFGEDVSDRTLVLNVITTSTRSSPT
jgi:hypothetical protein